MFTTLLETQKPTVTVIIFVGTFFAALTIGRLLKHRAGVRLGVLFLVVNLLHFLLVPLLFLTVNLLR